MLARGIQDKGSLTQQNANETLKLQSAHAAQSVMLSFKHMPIQVGENTGRKTKQ